MNRAVVLLLWLICFLGPLAHAASEEGEQKQHWAYRTIGNPPLPAVEDQSWPRNPIDQFVLAQLEREGISPAPQASRSTLIRRLYYDLIGLPPTPGEVDAFVADPSPAAYESLVDRLLQSPHFGERWGRHWLDKARYADSDGYEKDRPRPNAWRYRDWVINAINSDMPFDQFTIEQLAGDLLPESSPIQQLATAFHRQTLTNTEGGTDPEEFRVEATFDRTETTATVWMGLTMNCARCHRHKYDEISQQEYYQLFAFFNNANEAEADVATSQVALELYHQRKAAHEERIARLRRRYEATLQRLQPKVEIWQDHVSARLGQAAPLLNDAGKQVPASTAASRMLLTILATSLDPEAIQLIGRLAKLEKRTPQPPTMTVRVIAPATRHTQLLHRGDFLQPAEQVDPGVLAVLSSTHPLGSRRQAEKPDRLDLARWLVDPQHPLTSRVTVNQVWAHLFGRGIVATLNDFGVRGEPPTHPQLLDWLAYHFPQELGWSCKALIRMIVTSATYRQASQHRPELQEIDPTNHLLARQNRLRVEAEIVRDLHLSVSGLLSNQIGGPSVFPPLPEGVAELSYANNFKWKLSEGEDRYRRGMYTFFKRTAPYPNLTAFDCPDSNLTKLQRDSSNTPLQALVTLNNEVFAEAAQAMAHRVLSEVDGDDMTRLTSAMRLCIARHPTEAELQYFQELLDSARQYYRTNSKDALAVTNRHRAEDIATAENAAWIATLRMIMNLDEFIVRD